MVEHRRPDDRLLLLREDGAVIIESLAAMAVFFMLLVIIVQLAFAIVAHSTVGSAVDAAARRAARPAADLAEAERRLSLELTSVVPGANEVEATVTSRGGKVHVDAAVTWSPPGPDLVPIVIRAASATPLIVPP